MAGASGTASRARRPWHVRLRQGIAGAGIASIVVGGGMSVLLFRQRAVEGATATAPAAPRGAAAPPLAAPTCVLSPSAIASAPPAPALHASAAPPAPVPSSAPERRRRRYTPLGP